MQALKHDLRTFIIDSFLFGEAPAQGTLADEDSLLDAGIIDSTGVLELVMFVEERWGITIDDAELSPENLDSIARLAAFVSRKQALVAQ
jgi:acyl carrier protein